MNRLRLADPMQLSDNYQLAETGFLSQKDINEFYVSIPTDDGGVIKVREDYLDQYSDAEYNKIMDYLEPFQGEMTMSGLFSRVRENMQKRREERKENRSEVRTQRGETLKNIFSNIGKAFGGRGQEPEMDTRAVTGALQFGTGAPTPQQTRGKNTGLIIGGLAAGGLLLYLLTRKK